MAEMQEIKLTSIRLPEPLHRKAKAEAASQGISLSKLIVRGLALVVK